MVEATAPSLHRLLRRLLQVGVRRLIPMDELPLELPRGLLSPRQPKRRLPRRLPRRYPRRYPRRPILTRPQAW